MVLHFQTQSWSIKKTLDFFYPDAFPKMRICFSCVQDSWERSLPFLFVLRINIKGNFCNKFLRCFFFPIIVMVRNPGSNTTFACTEMGGSDAKAWCIFVLLIPNLDCIYVALLYRSWTVDAGGLSSFGGGSKGGKWNLMLLRYANLVKVSEIYWDIPKICTLKCFCFKCLMSSGNRSLTLTEQHFLKIRNLAEISSTLQLCE